MIALFVAMIEPAPAHTVHVWLADVPSPDAPHLAGWLGWLSAEERARFDRFQHAGARTEFLVGRALVRTTLSRYADVPPEAWAFAIGSHGRPDLATRPPGTPPLVFNLSHTRGLAACAVTVDRELGVDVEFTGRSFTHDVPGRFFAAEEVRALRALPEAEQHAVFFDYWTLKEAYIKARGLGLAIPLHQFAFTRHAGGGRTLWCAPDLADDGTTWQFWQGSPSPAHRLAVAVRRTGADLAVTVRRVIPGAVA
ncbi:MAG: 4'-phosphopantetheinyl transferase superfamily protein [Vicinamibacterales bacterium]